jgi:glucose-6-phosphate 1-epimerase
VGALSIEGLKGITYKDKVNGGVEATEESAELLVSSEIDRVYANVSGTVIIKDSGTPIFKIDRTNLEDVVVWNPYDKAAGMADFGPDDGYKNMS